MRLRDRRRGLARRGGAEGVVAGRAAAEGREVEGHFSFLWLVLVGSATQCLVWCLWLLPRPRYRLAGSARHEGDWYKCLCCVGFED